MRSGQRVRSGEQIAYQSGRPILLRWRVRLCPAFLVVWVGLTFHAAYSGVQLKSLTETDPPEVITFNHEYNLDLLKDEHGSELADIEKQRTERSQQCSGTQCRDAVSEEARRLVLLEGRRYELAIEAEQLEYETAVAAAKERLREEEQRQTKELEDRNAKLLQAQKEELKNCARRAAMRTEEIEQLLNEGDRATAPPPPNSYGDVSPLFKPRRRQYGKRAWAAPPPKESQESPGPVLARSTHPEAEPDKSRWESQEQLLVAMIARLEAILEHEPGRGDAAQQLAELRRRLNEMRKESRDPPSASEDERAR